MIYVPSIAMCGLLAMMSMVAAIILQKRWMKYVALGCALFETGMVAFLVIIARP